VECPVSGPAWRWAEYVVAVAVAHGRVRLIACSARRCIEYPLGAWPPPWAAPGEPHPSAIIGERCETVRLCVSGGEAVIVAEGCGEEALGELAELAGRWSGWSAYSAVY
jgi:hypothetical protein